MSDLIETTPQMDLVTQDIARLVEELLAPLPRKSLEPMVLAVDGVAPKAVRAMQSFISAG